ncbi:MAG: GlsB/YeaQ/YmgE family stress response membrane protein [Armatimonadetes bacterium]|nr:GlsB/YeaQ/YmgE family stress response membrane protein [Armatimonadota bacterium]
MIGLLLFILIAGVCGAIGEGIAGGKVGPGFLGSFIVGLIGAWIGGMLIQIGPVIAGVSVIPAILGSVLFVAILKLLTGRSVMA